MTSPEIIEEEAISMAELKNELAKIRRKEKELNFRANKTDEYLKQFTTLDHKKAAELFDKITTLDIPRIKESHIKKIIDLMPKKVEDLKVILEAYPITINQDNQKKIIGVVAEYL